MFRLVESIKYLDGKIYNLEYHNERFNRSRKELFGIKSDISLEIPIQSSALQKEIGLYKCRVIYSEDIEEIEFAPYNFRKINSVKIVYDDEIDYKYKYLDKEPFNKLLERKNKCDDIIIVKKGLITDASFANLVFFDGKKYYTPASPLLKGTKRAALLDQKIIFERDIAPEDLKSYKKLFFINAMIDLGQTGIDINNINKKLIREIF